MLSLVSMGVYLFKKSSQFESLNKPHPSKTQFKSKIEEISETSNLLLDVAQKKLLNQSKIQHIP